MDTGGKIRTSWSVFSRARIAKIEKGIDRANFSNSPTWSFVNASVNPIGRPVWIILSALSAFDSPCRLAVAVERTVGKAVKFFIFYERGKCFQKSNRGGLFQSTFSEYWRRQIRTWNSAFEQGISRPQVMCIWIRELPGYRPMRTSIECHSVNKCFYSHKLPFRIVEYSWW
jgi:hypothetical protein